MRRIIILGLFGFVAACSSTQQDQGAFDKTAIESEVLQMFAEYHEALNSQGMSAEFDYMDDSEDYFWVPPDATMALDYDSIKTIVLQNDILLDSVHFKWDTLQVHAISEMIATYSGKFRGDLVDKTGVISKITFLETGVLVKRNDGWKRLSGQSEVVHVDADVLD